MKAPIAIICLAALLYGCTTHGVQSPQTTAAIPAAQNQVQAVQPPEDPTLAALAQKRKLELKALGLPADKPFDPTPHPRQDYIDRNPRLSPEFKDAILHGRVLIGMSIEDFEASCQNAESLVVTSNVGGMSIDTYQIAGTYVTLVNGTVKEIIFMPDY